MTLADIAAKIRAKTSGFHGEGRGDCSWSCHTEDFDLLVNDPDYRLRERIEALVVDLERPYEAGFWQKGTPTGLAHRIRRDVLLDLPNPQPISLTPPTRRGRK